mgnify:FL=1
MCACAAARRGLSTRCVGSVVRALQARGMVRSHTDGIVGPVGGVAVYAGFDPTGPGLHVGHLVVLNALQVCAAEGMSVVALVGGGTGMIGDPSGRSTERNLLSWEETQTNAASVEADIRRILPDAKVLNNAEHIRAMTAVDLVRDVGKHVRINTLLRLDSIAGRLDSQEGISFTEFSYCLLQAADFLWLHQTENVVLQLGGSDQWGNITLGVDLIRRKLQSTVHGITLPLLTTSDGKKIGKSTTMSSGESRESAVWLDPQKNQPL